jgi:hypothetical protein
MKKDLQKKLNQFGSFLKPIIGEIPENLRTYLNKKLKNQGQNKQE